MKTTVKQRQPQKKHVGYCIYCGHRDASLSDEHTIPYSLMGNQVLGSASCREHAETTSALEQYVCGQLWEHAREFLQFPSRKAKKRRKWTGFRNVDFEKYLSQEVYSMRVQTGLSAPNLLFPVRSYQPRYLTGKLKDSIEGDRSSLAIIPLSSRMPPTLHRVYSPSYHVDVVRFERFICKVALCEFHLNANTEYFPDPVIDFVLGKEVDQSLIIGNGKRIPNSTNRLHSVRLQKKNLSHSIVDGSVGLIELSLFDWLKSPIYQVVLRSNG